MRVITLVCENGGERLDVFLAANLSEMTRSAAQKLLEAGRVSLSRQSSADSTDSAAKLVVHKNYRTSPGDIFTVTQDEPGVSVVIKQNIRLDIIFEDSDVIVVNKPRGMVVHPAPGHPDGTLVNALLHHCRDSLSGIGGVIRPGIVHRLDKDTSGLIIAAKNDNAHLSLASQLSSRTLTREYDAVVCGNVKNNCGTIDAPIGRHPTDRKRQAVHALQTTQTRQALRVRQTAQQSQQAGQTARQSQQDGRTTRQSQQDGQAVKAPRSTNSRPAVTHYKVVALYDGYTHVRCRLETGRTHQIRVHMAYIGYPVLGDVVYGRKKPELGQSCQCLHASKLCFVHPTTKKPIELCSALPDYFLDVLASINGVEPGTLH